MIREIKVKNDDGDEINLFPSPKFLMLEPKGFGSVGASISKSDIAGQDGTRVNSSYLADRNITFKVKYKRPDIEKNRILLYNYLRPGRKVRLYVRNDSRDAYIDGVVEQADPDIFSENEMADVSIICPNPYWIATASFQTDFSTVDPMFSFPFAIEEEGIPFSVLEATPEKTIVNSGDAETGALIRIESKGSVTNPMLYDESTGEVMKFAITLAKNEYLLIDTHRGSKSIEYVTEDSSFNGLPYLAAGSSWLKLAIGENKLYSDAEQGKDDMTVTVKHNVWYSGV